MLKALDVAAQALGVAATWAQPACSGSPLWNRMTASEYREVRALQVYASSSDASLIQALHQRPGEAYVFHAEVLDLIIGGDPMRVFTLLHDARPLLLNFGEPTDIAPWWMAPVTRFVLHAGPEPVAAADAWRRIDAFLGEHLAG